MKFLFTTYILVLIIGTSPAFCQNQLTPSKENSIYLIIGNETKPLAFTNKKEIILHLKELISIERENGFLTAYFEKLEKLNDSTYITTITKANKENTSFIEISNFKNLPKILKEEFLTKDNNPQIPIEELNLTLSKLNAKLSKTGYPFNTVKLENLKKLKNSLKAELKIEGLNKRQIDSITIKGYDQFPIGYLKHYAGVKTKSIYNNENILKQTQLINALSFVNATKPAEVLFNPKKTVLYLYLQKANANNFDGYLGFSTEEDTGEFILNGYLNLNLINNFNLGEELKIAYKNDSETQQEFSIDTKLPYIFNLPLGIEASLSIFTQQDEFSTTEQNIGFNYTFTPRIEAFAGYKKYESADLNEDESIVSTYSNFESQFLQTELRYIHRQNKLLFPQKTSATLSSEIGTRTPTNTRQYKIGIDAKHIFQLNNRNSIYLANNIQYFISSNFLSNELYILGGILSIRGFEENSLRATFYNVLNTEYRYQLSNSIYVHSIIDLGFLANDFARTRDRLTSFGVGLGMLSKAGLFKLNYANGRSDNIPFEFGNSKVHLSLTAYF